MEIELHETIFEIPKMDCPSEEGLVRMALEKSPHVKKLSFDLEGRKLTAIHDGAAEDVLQSLVPLNFGARISETRTLSEVEEVLAIETKAANANEAKVLKKLLFINATMFVVEMTLGWFAESAGLIADSLDMFADAAVYGLSLYAVGRATALKHRVARSAGYLELLLALGAISEVVRRFFFGSDPEAAWMIGVSFLALVANVSCLLLLSKHRSGGVHMKASWIFSTNDVIANSGVILAGVLVMLTSSPLPDLVIGCVIGMVVFSGAIRILKVAAAA